MEDWNDLRFVLAVSRAGALTAAAKSLGIDHSTAFRRLNALEERLGLRLFERLPGGVYEPTPGGERMASAAERMEAEALTIDRDLAGRDHRLAGRLRVTCSETLAYRLLTGHIAAFRQAYPGITVELMIDNRVLSLSRREADIALRPVRPKEPELWGRKLADVAWAVYAMRNSAPVPVDAVRERKDLSGYPLIGWNETAGEIAAASWLSRAAPDDAFVFRTNSLVNQLIAAKAGMGLALLPCYLGDFEPELVRFLPEPMKQMAGELWVVTHADIKRTARVRAFFDLVSNGLAAERDLFEGRRAQPEAGLRSFAPQGRGERKATPRRRAAGRARG